MQTLRMGTIRGVCQQCGKTSKLNKCSLLCINCDKKEWGLNDINGE